MQQRPDNRSGRMVILLIAGIPVTIILAATWLWWFVMRGDLDLVGALGTANKGELVQPPRPLPEHALMTASGAELPWTNSDHQWTLLVAHPGERCAETCERQLYLTRQIHIALGKEFHRIRRYYVGDHAPDATRLDLSTLSDDHPVPGSFPELLDKEHQGITAAQVSSETYRALFPETLEAPSTWYLVDPAGWVMMTYDNDDTYKDVISDLKFLLKNSGD